MAELLRQEEFWNQLRYTILILVFRDYTHLIACLTDPPMIVPSSAAYTQLQREQLVAARLFGHQDGKRRDLGAPYALRVVVAEGRTPCQGAGPVGAQPPAPVQR
ncbi:MAG: hypothetical protein V2L15_08565, partial [Desulfobacteraceae bacterium]|nr:hypothetical protein [Desulfobacteraceae bacterium]